MLPQVNEEDKEIVYEITQDIWSGVGFGGSEPREDHGPIMLDRWYPGFLMRSENTIAAYREKIEARLK